LRLEQPATTPSHTGDARTADASREAATDDHQDDHQDVDEDAPREEVSNASPTEETRTDDAAHQPVGDDGQDTLQQRVTLAADGEDTRTDDARQQPPTGDGQDDWPEELDDESDGEDAPTDDAVVMETAGAEADPGPTLGDQAGSQPAASAPVISEVGFSFVEFAKPGIPAEVAKDAMPADQAFPVEESSRSGIPGSEGADPDLDSADVGNAAPSKDPVVHHGDLAP